MGKKEFIGLLTVAAVLLSGCSRATDLQEQTQITCSSTPVTTENSSDTITETTSGPTSTESFEFNPHVYSPKMAERFPQDYWDSFYNLCDALRAGESSFECSSQEAYDWCTDTIVLNNLFPAACESITNKTGDGSASYENGTGKIYYTIPVEEFVVKESDFESLIVNILNYHVEADDTEYERALKLYLYVAENFEYGLDRGDMENTTYGTFMTMKGTCINLASAYAYLLLQTGIDAINIGCSESGKDHAWTYAVINGKAYHIDTTYALRTSNPELMYICLDYFMMSDENRISDGYPVNDLTVQLLPEFWASRSSMVFPAPDSSFNLRSGCGFVSLDEDNKILTYADDKNVMHTFCYEGYN